MSRRSTRVPAQPHRLADEQASHQYQAQDLLDLRRVMEQSLAPDMDSESDEEAPPDDESSSSEEEEEEKENVPPQSSWTEHTQDIKLPPCTEQPASNLPRHCVRTELGCLQCFLPPSLIATVATSTNLYAAFKQAPTGWATTPEEVWLFIAVHIFMGIVHLPYLHMYWEGQWRQQYVVDAFSRDRFTQLLRYFHIAEPTPPGVKQTVVDKVAPLWDHCLAVFPEYFTPPQILTLDETMVRYNGRSPWKTVIPGKPTPIGYKLWTVGSYCYLLTFDIYRGKGGYAVQQNVIHRHSARHAVVWEQPHPLL
jgi:hypothetical protein